MLTLPLEQLILLIPVLLMSLSFHEFAHGKMSDLLGDPTPRIYGRLTINPLPHLDLLGTLVLLITGRFGWAKPVPVNPGYYQNPRRGLLLVGLAGPGMNFILAAFFALVHHLIPLALATGILKYFSLLRTIMYFLQVSVIINIALAIFNLLPVPPLDGSKVLRGLLPARLDYILDSLEGGMGMVILLMLLFTNVLSRITWPIIHFFFRLLI